jgi:hypothetical protein
MRASPRPHPPPTLLNTGNCTSVNISGTKFANYVLVNIASGVAGQILGLCLKLAEHSKPKRK